MVAKLSIKVVPGSSQNRIVGWLGKVLKIPEKNVKVIAGKTSPRKIVELTGLTKTEVDKKLSEYGLPK